MPEGPEVKIASDYFNSFFNSSKSIKFEIISDYYYDKYQDVFKNIKDNLRLFRPTYTIGKNIFLDLDNQDIFNFHLGMTGGWSKKNIKHCHFRVFDNKKELFFKDVRKFGKMRIITQTTKDEKFNPLFDILNPVYDYKKHVKSLREKIRDEKSICCLIMDQKYFPGVGNYIKSEGLYLSRIHPEEKWKNLKSRKINLLIKNLQKVMYASYKTGGAELKDFKNPFNQSEFKLRVYGKILTDKKNPVTSLLTSDSRKSWICKKSQKLKAN